MINADDVSTRGRPRRRISRAAGLLATLTALLFAVFAQSALAGNISGSSGTYTFTATAGAPANTISVTSVSSTQISITDSTETLTESSASCTSSGGVVTCNINSSGSTAFVWNLSTTDDTLTIDDAVNVKDTVTPGTGADVMTCGDGKDRVTYAGRTVGVRVTPSDTTANDGELTEFDNVGTSCEASTGGNGPDYLLSSSDGALWLDGNSGNDFLVGSPANTSNACTSGVYDGTLYGDGGNDTLISLAGGSTLNGNTGDDRLIGSDDTSAGCDWIWGGSGNDLLIGGAGNDVLVDGGQSGEKNTLIPGSGADSAGGGWGDDEIIARDGEIDWGWTGTVCDQGTDFLIRDAEDETDAQCEDEIVTP